MTEYTTLQFTHPVLVPGRRTAHTLVRSHDGKGAQIFRLVRRDDTVAVVRVETGDVVEVPWYGVAWAVPAPLNAEPQRPKEPIGAHELAQHRKGGR